MVERHPHVFGDQDKLETAQDVLEAWEARKRRQKGRGVLDGVPTSLPALHRAHQLTTRAATVGFDWDNVDDVLGKVDEEVGELKEALASGEAAHIEDELGDTLFALVNLARHLGLDAERALRGTNRKFTRRFAYVEGQLQAQGSSPQEASLEEMDALWNQAKGAT
jgi:ATP diphosphatase